MDVLLALLALPALAATAGPAADTAPIECESCPAWNAPQAPFRIHGGTWYVGTRGLASVLIDTGDGLILLDGALPQSAQPIARNITAAGFRIEDLRWIVNSHAHFDHAGGIAALARMSGAEVAASPRGAEALREGMATLDDPQAGWRGAARFPAMAEVAEIADGGSLALGSTTLNAHHTPGHTPGSTSWSWRSCEGEYCVDIVYADSLTPVAAPGFRYGDQPERVAAFRRSIDTVAALPCDVLIAPHPEFTALFARHEAASAGDPDAFVDPEACRHYAERARQNLERRLESERTGAP